MLNEHIIEKNGGMKGMKQKFIPFVITAVILLVFSILSSGLSAASNPDIKRVTFSGNDAALFPCLSENGNTLLYILEIKTDEETTRAVKIKNLETGEEKEIFCDGELKAREPFEGIDLVVGSKPPVLSGNGKVAVFSLSLGEPANIMDHYLAVMNIEEDNPRIISFPISSLEGKNIESFDFTSNEWERVSLYGINNEGNRIACLLKGHLGPRRYGDPSGIVFLDVKEEKQETLLGPEFKETGWSWPSFPSQPCIGGGWAFAMSGSGDTVVFGARVSVEKTDYDLFAAGWTGKEITKITSFHDRWFGQADISDNGKKIAFFYNGKKEQGIGTYIINTDGSGLEYLESETAPRVEFYDMSGDGRYILFKDIYQVKVLDLQESLEFTAFNENTPGYVSGMIPMDFPRYPSFWSPRITNKNGEVVLLAGPPQGKESPEIYLLNLK
jgi:hypothetical protein